MKISNSETPAFGSILAILLAFTAQANAQSADLSESEIYARCHLRLARRLPDPNAEATLAVAAGQRTASAACLALLDTARFDANGRLPNPNDATSKTVLKTLHDFHRDWFTMRAPEGNDRADLIIRDYEEPALYLTRAAFSPNVSYSSIVTYDKSLRGVRVGPPARTAGRTRFEIQPLFSYNAQQRADFPFANQNSLTVRFPIWQLVGTVLRAREQAFTFPDSAIISVGELIGVEDVVPVTASNMRFPVPPTTNATQTAAFTAAESSYRFLTHAGGGILGTETYPLMNTNLGSGEIPFEVASTHRRLTGRIYEDLMCHELPTLTLSDVQSMVQPDSQYTFQRSASCMQCHATLDPLANTYRNFVYVRTGNANSVGTGMGNVYRLPASANHQDFAAKPPTGEIHYRPLLGGSPVRQNVEGTAAAGNALAGSRDLYLCAAKKYYRFLTGIDVQLARREEAANAVRAFHQKEVERMGDALKEHQSLRLLVKDIFESPAFRSRDYKKGGK